MLFRGLFGAMEPGPIKESDKTVSDALLAQLLKDVVAVTRMMIHLLSGLGYTCMALQDWMAEPSLQALAVQDKGLIQRPVDDKGQEHIPTALGLKLNCVPCRSLCIEYSMHGDILHSSSMRFHSF